MGMSIYATNHWHEEVIPSSRSGSSDQDQDIHFVELCGNIDYKILNAIQLERVKHE
jgi:hypothetical protein